MLAVASASLAAVPATAQIRDGGPADTRGLTLGLSVNGNTVRGSGDVSDRAVGAGVSAMVGYGATDALTLFARGAYMYRNSYADLGVRYSFGGAGGVLRPYAEGAATLIRTSENGVQSSGGGGTLGVGAEYFLTKNLGVDVGVGYTRGRFTNNKIDGVPLDADRNYGSPRFGIGLRWRP